MRGGQALPPPHSMSVRASAPLPCFDPQNLCWLPLKLQLLGSRDWAPQAKKDQLSVKMAGWLRTKVGGNIRRNYVSPCLCPVIPVLLSVISLVLVLCVQSGDCFFASYQKVLQAVML